MSTPIVNIEQASNSSLWDRVTTWASDNKAVAYTIAGTVIVVTAGGAIYYLSDSKPKSTVHRKSKKERREEKRQAKEAASREQPTSESVGGIKLKDEEAGKDGSVRD